MASYGTEPKNFRLLAPIIYATACRIHHIKQIKLQTPGDNEELHLYCSMSLLEVLKLKRGYNLDLLKLSTLDIYNSPVL